MTADTKCKIRILSYGAGIQTAFLLFLYWFRYDFIVFADTGNEDIETYNHINKYVIPFCKEKGIPFVRVYNKYGVTLYEYCFNKKIVPSIKYRDCTSKMKIAPIRKFLRKELHADRRKNIILQDIGISYDEFVRASVSNVQYIINEFPLVDLKLTRGMCKRIMKILKIPAPPKSGCWFCPFARKYKKQYIPKIIELEENNSRFPEILLRGMASKKVKPIQSMQILENDAPCAGGYCHV